MFVSSRSDTVPETRRLIWIDEAKLRLSGVVTPRDHRPMETARASSDSLRRFEKVVVFGSRPDEYDGSRGTIVWVDEGSRHRNFGPVFVVHLSELDRYVSFLGCDLHSTHEIDPAGEEPHLGRRFEISFDTMLDDGDNGTVEGSFRVPGSFWQVFVFLKGDVGELRPEIGPWRSGIYGAEFVVPRSATVNRKFVIGVMSEAFGTRDWAEVHGPDSLALK